MQTGYSTIPFADPARAEINIARIEPRLAPGLRASLPSLVSQMPAPDDALNFLERFVRPDGATPGAGPRVLAFLEQNPAALHYLLTVFSYSRFLSETILQQPELITTLLRPPRPDEGAGRGPRGIERSRTLEDLEDEFARFEATSFDVPPAVVLARFKRREYLRIMLRDVLKLATLAETTLELSQLADVLLERALRRSERKLAAAYGTPQFAAPDGRLAACGLTIISLGKLGGQELNYNSDIDLMCLYAAEGETSGGAAGAITNREFFARLVQALLQLVTESTPEGAVYRVDLRLRPQGSEGEIAISVPAALDYYRTRAREWELQSLIRARGSAGDRETARVFLKEVRPLVYQREFRLEVVEAVLNARQQITRTLTRREARRAHPRGRRAGAQDSVRYPAHDVSVSQAEGGGAINVKLSPGGIRDIEFLTQCLQRLYGGEDPWLQAAPTLVALQRLHDKRYIEGRDFQRLAAAYQFLRTIEHRLQLRDGLQRHELPEAPDSLDRLARRCGIEQAPDASGEHSPGAVLLASLAEHFERVREIYSRLLLRRHHEGGEPGPRAGAAEDTSGPTLMSRLEEEFPAVGAEIARLTAGLDSTHYLRRGLLRYLNSALLSPALLARLEVAPERLRDAAALFDRSDLVVDLLAHHPQEIECLAETLPASAERMLPFERAAAQRADDLRYGYRLALLREIASQLLGPDGGAQPAPFPFLDRLTSLAEDALRQALRIAAEESAGSAAAAGFFEPFAVLALGRMGSREMSIGSDADLLFVVEGSLSSADRGVWRRTAERFVQLVGSHTREGVIFAVDTRLRPRGGEGELVPSVEALCEYLAKDAAAWEAVTFLKLRPVAGNLELGARAVAQTEAILRARFAGPARAAELARELGRIRAKVEQDAAGPRAKGRFKKMAGGYYDLEYVIGYLTLANGLTTSAGNTWAQIQPLEAGGALDAAGIETLRTTAVLYRAADHAARLVTGRPLAGWPEPALAERISRLLRQWGVMWEGEMRAALEERGHAIRALYRATLG
jgi:[glutamine synthetase] adenylyltransferase / [glutamine synthetase]-adenylyl-L-tyrosine phosphorylase